MVSETKRRCTQCDTFKVHSEYYGSNPSGWCKTCTKRINGERRARVWKEELDLMHQAATEQLVKCKYCPEAEPMFLQFDHIKGKKRGTIANMKHYGLKTLREEIAKCQVICVRCHFFLTAKRGNYYQYRRMVEEGHPLVEKFKDIA